MNSKNLYSLNQIKYLSLSFKIGILLLVSAPAISAIFLIFAATGGFILQREKILKDKFNIFLFFITSLIISITIFQTFLSEIPYKGWEPYLSWIGLFNWIPLFFCFIGFQPFLNSKNSRRSISLIFLLGTVPLVISGFLQYFFKIYGPFDAFNGLVIWYSRPLAPDEGLTGLFNNRNYTSAWFSIIIPFSIAYVLEKDDIKKRILTLIPLLIILVTTFLTFSRSAWLNAILSFLLLIGKSSILFLIVICFLFYLLVLSCFGNFNILNISSLFDSSTYYRFCSKFSEFGFSNSHRLIIFENALNLIQSRPLIGYGASSFATLYFINTGRSTTHTHNLLMDLAINYGLPVSILTGSFVIKIIIESYREIYLNKQKVFSLFDKAWWTSCFIMIISHLYDNTYYDLRISISCWVILAGLRNIIRNKQKLLY